MFDDLLNNTGRNEQFAKAQSNMDAVDPHDAAEYVGEFMRNAPPEVQQQVLRQYVSQLDPRQRQALGQAMVQHQDTPVQDVRDDDDDDLVGALARSGQALSTRPNPSQGLGGLFGMFGNMMGGGQGQQGGLGGMLGGGQPQGGFGGLGGLLGGGQPQQPQQPQYQQPYPQQQNPQPQNPMGGLGGLLENPMARAGLVSLAAVIGSQLMRGRR